MIDCISEIKRKKMSQGQLDLARMLGVSIGDSDKKCTICNKNIYAAGSPLPPPCAICGRENYCVRCSRGAGTPSGKIEMYCTEHLPSVSN